jgi:site-specific DNA recombinase
MKRSANDAGPIRCAVYTRKSTEEGLQQEFNSLDAQRDAGEAYIASQGGEGWVALPDRYDDGGFTGGNTDRPALKRLMADVEAGKVDCVVVYKADRLSRSLPDFARIMEIFDRHQVAFVSVTQQFNTACSMGRLMLHVLLSFAQFERELISERTRDKMAAARRKGKWVGGRPILGYDVVDTKLIVNAEEAARVRAIFQFYLDYESLLPVVTELARRGWRTKEYMTRKGKQVGGYVFCKTRVHQLLTNPAYVGNIRFKDEVFAGEHQGIVDPDVFERVQAILARNRIAGGAEVRNKYGALLRGLLFCGPCGRSMGHTYSQKGNRRHRYYVCHQAQQHGRATCRSKSVPAATIEKFVVDQIRAVGRDPALVAETIAQAQGQASSRIVELEVERAAVSQVLRRSHADLQRLATEGTATTAALAELQERIRTCELREQELGRELAHLREGLVDQMDVRRALAEFDPVWTALAPREQVRLVKLLVERVEYDGQSGDVSVTFRSTGIRELAKQREDAA